MSEPWFFFAGILDALRMPLLIDTTLILVVWGVCRFGQRVLSPALRCYLWRLTYVKLLLTAVFMGSGIPVQIPALPHPVVTTIKPPPPEVRAADPTLPDQWVGKVEYPHSLLWAVNQVVEPSEVRINTADTGNSSRSCEIFVNVIAGSGGSNVYGYTSGPVQLWTDTPLGAGTCGLLYCGGTALLFWRMMRSLRRARRLRSAAQPVTDAASRTMLDDLSRRLGLKRAPRLGQVSALPGPLYTLGTILIPSEGLPTGTTSMVFAHEAAHARRRDLVWEWLGALTQALFFFHPLVYLARREERVARESAADAIALHLTGASAAEYARMLLDLSTKASAPPIGAVGAIENGSALHRRIQALKQPRDRVGWIDKTLIALATLLLTATLVPVEVRATSIETYGVVRDWFPKDDPYPHAPKDPFQIKGNKHLFGVVRDSHGKPIPGLWIQVWRTFFADVGPNEVRVAWSDRNGRFDISNLPSGEYQMWAGDPQIGDVNEISNPSELYGFQRELVETARKLPAHVPAATGYYGDVPTFYIAPSQRDILERNMIAYRPSKIRGRLIDRVTGAPIAGIAVGMGSGNGVTRLSGGLTQDVTDIKGRFTLGTEKPGPVIVGAGMFTDQYLRADSFRVKAVQASCTARANKTVVLPDIITDRLPLLRFVGPHHEPLGRIRVALTPPEVENLPDFGNFDTRGKQRLDADERRDLLIFRLQSGAFSAASGDGRLAVSGAFQQAPDGSLAVTVNGIRKSFADGIAVISVPVARSTATQATKTAKAKP